MLFLLVILPSLYVSITSERISSLAKNVNRYMFIGIVDRATKIMRRRHKSCRLVFIVPVEAMFLKAMGD